METPRKRRAKRGRPPLTPQNDTKAIYKAVVLADISTPSGWRPDWQYGHHTWPASVEGAIRRMTEIQEGRPIPSGGGELLVRNERGGTVKAEGWVKHLREYFSDAGGCRPAIDAWIINPASDAARIPAIADAIRAANMANEEARRRDPVEVVGELVFHALLMKRHGAEIVGRMVLTAANTIEIAHGLPPGFTKIALLAFGAQCVADRADPIAAIGKIIAKTNR